jgi:hypothetical protein
LQQFGRKAKVEIFSNDVLFLHEGVGRVVIENLRIVFDVEKGLMPYNKARVDIYNLAPKTRAWIRGLDKNKAQVVVWVKHQADVDWLQLFKSDLSISRDVFDKPDIITKLDCDDGRITLEKPVVVQGKVGDQIQNLIDGVREDVDAIMKHPLKSATKLLTTGYNFTGKAKAAFEDLVSHVDDDYNMVDDELVVIPIEGNNGLPAQLLNEETGLIGVPEQIDDVLSISGRKKKKDSGSPVVRPGYDVRCLLSPLIIPGSQIHLQSRRLDIDGNMDVKSVKHNGDTHGDDWTTEARVVFSK